LDKLSEEPLKEQNAFAPKKPEPSSLADLTRRASVVTPLLSDMLARIEGVPRWGLNE
jgi:hypothetical protein